MNFELHHGDNLEVLRYMADASVDSIVTDPPYELGFMGKGWDKSGIANNVYLWAECLRVLKPGGHLLAFGGSRTAHRMVCAIEDAGFEVRDTIMWIYGSGFPKSKNLDGAWEGWGTALKPAHEPICMARKPLARPTVKKNVQRYDTGALNIDGCRVPMGDEYDPTKVQRQQSNRVTWEGGEASGFKADHEQATYNAAGRWPANVMHDGSDEVIAAFPQAKGQQGATGTRTQGAVYGQVDGGQAGVQPRADTGSAARFFYCAKAIKADREEGLEAFAKVSKSHIASTDGGGGGLAKDAEKNPNLPRANYHPTVKPTDLMRYLCRLVTPPGGTVLDPFMGSGSTGKAAMLEGFRFVGIDLTAEYVEIARARIAHAAAANDNEPPQQLAATA